MNKSLLLSVSRILSRLSRIHIFSGRIRKVLLIADNANITKSTGHELHLLSSWQHKYYVKPITSLRTLASIYTRITWKWRENSFPNINTSENTHSMHNHEHANIPSKSIINGHHSIVWYIAGGVRSILPWLSIQDHCAGRFVICLSIFTAFSFGIISSSSTRTLIRIRQVFPRFPMIPACRFFFKKYLHYGHCL